MVSARGRPRQRARARGARHDGDRRARHGAGPCPRQGLARGRRREGRARRVVQSRLSCSLAAARPICAGRRSAWRSRRRPRSPTRSTRSGCCICAAAASPGTRARRRAGSCGRPRTATRPARSSTRSCSSTATASPRDERLAARYFRRAAGRGNTIAQNRLARLYAVGRGVPKNLTEAAAWHLLASGRGLTDTWLDETLKGLSAEERAAAEKLAAQRADLI